MLLAAGALSALAIAALPAMASAGEFEAHCSTGESCVATVTGGAATLADDSGGSAGKIECTSLSGLAIQSNTSSTGLVQLFFHGCKDETALHTSCHSAGQPAGTIQTNELVSHLVYIDATPTVLVGVLLTNVNVTILCAGDLVKKTVTGNLIGKIENPECGVARTHHTIEFATTEEAKKQEYTQVTTPASSA